MLLDFKMSFLCPEAINMLHYGYNVRAAIPLLEKHIGKSIKKCKGTAGNRLHARSQHSILFLDDRQTELGAGLFFE